MISSILIKLCLAAALVWFLTLARMLRVKSVLRHVGAPAMQSRDRRVSVIVPARNEARDIQAALTSLLAQQGVKLELLAVNDHSRDNTGNIIDQIAQLDERVRPIHNPELQPGWFGKVNAMQAAANVADGNYLLFTDADVVHANDLLWSAISEMEAGGYDFMTLVPRFDMRAFWENVDLPMVFSGLAMLASVHLENPDKPDAVGGGAFMLIRREVFEAIGGFEPIRAEMFDDVELARLVKANGYKVGIRLATDRLHVELYKTNRDAFLAPTKNILGAGLGQPWLAGFAALLSVALYWSPPLAMILGLVQADRSLWVTGLGVYLFQYLSFYLAREAFRFHPLKLLGYPLVVLVILTCTTRALYYYYVKGSVAWRGRVIRHSGQ